MSRKSGIFNFIKLPNLMVGLVALFLYALGSVGVAQACNLYTHTKTCSDCDRLMVGTGHYRCRENECAGSRVVKGTKVYTCKNGSWGDGTEVTTTCKSVPGDRYVKQKSSNATPKLVNQGGGVPVFVNDGVIYIVPDDLCVAYECPSGYKPDKDKVSCVSKSRYILRVDAVGPSPKFSISSDDGNSYKSFNLPVCTSAQCENKANTNWECDNSNVTKGVIVLSDISRGKYANSVVMTSGWTFGPFGSQNVFVCYTGKAGDATQAFDSSEATLEATAPVDAEQEQESTTPANTTAQQAETQSSTTTDASTTPAASSGACNTQEEKEKRGAIEIQKQGALCVATKCKSDHYKVKDASGAYQGWCIYKECPAGQRVDTDKDGMVLANDIKCVADTATDAEAKVEAPGEASGDADAETSAATETVDATSDPASEKETPAPAGPADGEECTKPGARRAEYRNGKCIAMECDDGYEPSGDDCVKISGPCESLPAHAVRGHRKYNADTGDTECIIEDCDDGYVVADDKLSCHEDYDALAEQAREREQSTGNKLIGALGMGATGIGGSMLMSGLAESNADDDAERAMSAYLETFTCKYGNESVSGGTMNVEIPGGNELINMYSEYVALANDLKLRKAALGMKPGIESEPILDSATSGLYDDVGTGRGKGAYASLARALENPDGEDAKAWAAQREESEKKKKTGAIVAGIGAVGSLIGNAAINADWGKNKHKALRDLEEDVNNIRPSSTPCPDGTIGLEHPDCVCVNRAREYNRDTGKCEVPETKSTTVTDTLDRLWEPDETVTAVLSASSLFEINSSKLLPQAKRALNEFIDKLKVKQGCVLTISGYTDPTGDYDKNYDLSMKRAQSVADYISDKNSNVDVQPEGFGEHSCTCGTRKYLKGGQIDYSKEDYKICRDKEDSHKLSGGDIFAPCRRVEIQMQNCELESDVAAALEQGAGEIAGSALGSLTSAVTGQ